MNALSSGAIIHVHVIEAIPIVEGCWPCAFGRDCILPPQGLERKICKMVECCCKDEGSVLLAFRAVAS